MDGLQRSTSSYRRQGSSGLVWEDNTFSGELKKVKMERSASTGGGRGFRTVKVAPDMDPPSPKIVSCGLWKLFAKRPAKHQRRK